MGSSLSVDGQRQQGVASFFGCCAAIRVRDDIHDAAPRAGPETFEVCHEQPQPIPIPQMMAPRPATSGSMVARHTRSLSRPSFSLRRPSTARIRRPTIGAPSDFRKVAALLGASSDFEPLTLSVAQPAGRISPLPDFNRLSLISKRESVMSCNMLDFEKQLLEALERRASKMVKTDADPDMPDAAGADASLMPQDGQESLLHNLKPATRARANTEPARVLRRKRSGLLQKDSSEIDDAIRELEAIVEEKRTGEAQHSPALTRSNSRQHVPKIAPSMKMRVRTKTLSDIGSAFSRPFSNATRVPDSPTFRPVSHIKPESTDFASDSPPMPLVTSSSRSASQKSRAARFAQITRWMSLSRARPADDSHEEDYARHMDEPISQAGSLDIPRAPTSSGLPPRSPLATQQRRASAASLASSCSSASTISTSRFPTVPTTPTLSRSHSQLTARSSHPRTPSQECPALAHGKMLLLLDRTDPPLPFPERRDSRWSAAGVGIAC